MCHSERTRNLVVVCGNSEMRSFVPQDDTTRDTALAPARGLSVAATLGEIGPRRRGGRPLGIAELGSRHAGSPQIRALEIGIAQVGVRHVGVRGARVP